MTDKEAIIELQKIDCNCNDCFFMRRNLDKRPLKNIPAPINYGYCTKFIKEVTFIPATCQLDTQECFLHRKEKDSVVEAHIRKINNDGIIYA